MEHSAVRIK